jgi:hypothetical protein
MFKNVIKQNNDSNKTCRYFHDLSMNHQQQFMNCHFGMVEAAGLKVQL